MNESNSNPSEALGTSVSGEVLTIKGYNKFQSRTFLFALLWSVIVILALIVTAFTDQEIPLKELITAASTIVSLFMAKGAVKEWRRPAMTTALNSNKTEGI